jgi:hypothetical protein
MVAISAVSFVFAGVVLMRPAGSERATNGSIYTIRWTFSSGDTGIIHLSFVNRYGYYIIIGTADVTQGYLRWQLPAMPEPNRGSCEPIAIEQTMGGCLVYTDSVLPPRIFKPDTTSFGMRYIGENVQINWLSEGRIGDSVNILLCKDTVQTKVLKAKYADLGAYTWSIDSQVAPYDTYNILIRSDSLKNIRCYMPLRINYRPFIKLVAPRKGDRITLGTAYVIKWNQIGITGSTVNITLIQHNGLPATIGSNVPNTGSFSFVPSPTIDTTKIYSLQIVSSLYSSLRDLCDSLHFTAAAVTAVHSAPGALPLPEKTLNVRIQKAVVAYIKSKGLSAEMSLSDLRGRNMARLLEHAGESRKEFDATALISGNLSPGAYMLFVRTDSDCIHKKIIVSR